MANISRYFLNNKLKNYNHIIVSENGSAIAIDPLDIDLLSKNLTKYECNLTTILITHSHADHYAGAMILAKKFPEIKIITHILNKNNLSFATDYVKNGDVLNLASDISLKVIHTPGHVADHICFLNKKDKYIISGDMLFSGGIGRVLNTGSIEELYDSFESLKKVPLDYKLYTAHDYIRHNLHFNTKLFPDNNLYKTLLKSTKIESSQNRSITTMAEERKLNLFYDCSEKYLADILNTERGFETFKKLRKLRDAFY